MNHSPTTEERIWAVISHLSALALGMGIVLPIVGWSDQREKSRYGTFQCLQALGYQSLGYTVWLLSYLLLLVLLLFVSLVTASQDQWNGSLPTVWVVVILTCMFGLLALYLILPVIAAIACALGKDFHYPILGRRLARYLGDGSLEENSPALPEEPQDRWVTAMGHFSVIILFWGLLAPAATWVLQGRRNAFLKFQSVQTTLYQVGVTLLTLGGMALSFLGTLPLLVLTGLESSPNGNTPTSMAGLFIFFISMLVALLFLMVVPLFHILGQWAGYRVLKGVDYHYPILGRIVEKYFAR